MTRPALLIVGLEEEDRQILARAAKRVDCDLIGAGTIQAAIRLVRGRVAPVIVCRRDLPDGDWRDLLNLAAIWKSPVKLIVVCRLADNRLWSEVLNLGGYDLLASPLDDREVSYVLGSACRDAYEAEPVREEEPLGAPVCSGSSNDRD
jgi:DNA-binding NtrC family response regulator